MKVGQTYRTGAITKQGRRGLRMAMVEAARTAVEHHPHLEGTIRAALSTTGKEQSDCGHCSQTPGRGLACPHQS